MLYCATEVQTLSVRLRVEDVHDQVENFVWIKHLASERKESVSDLPQVKQVLNKRLHECHLAEDQVQEFGDVWIDRFSCQHLQYLSGEKYCCANRCAHFMRDC